MAIHVYMACNVNLNLIIYTLCPAYFCIHSLKIRLALLKCVMADSNIMCDGT